MIRGSSLMLREEARLGLERRENDELEMIDEH
jgi:hypothetical protein